MADFRLYFLSSVTDKIVAVETFTAENDVAGIAVASFFAGGRKMELWSGARKIIRFEIVSRLSPSSYGRKVHVSLDEFAHQ